MIVSFGAAAQLIVRQRTAGSWQVSNTYEAMNNPKKSRERSIFNMIYGSTAFAEVIDCECPDFLVRHNSVSSFFGVEVTEFYQSETDARLDQIPGYISELLKGKDFRHKADRKTLKVAKVEIVKADGSVSTKDVPAILEAVPKPNDCARLVAERIRSKTSLIRNCTAGMSHANLIIYDRTNLLYLVRKADFCRVYLIPELIAEISQAPFREVFLISTIEREELYARLKMLYLLSEVFSFKMAIASREDQPLNSEINTIELFASYLASNVKSPVLIRYDTSGTEVIYGDCGTILKRDNSIIVKLYRDYPISSDARPIELEWQKVLGTGFYNLINTLRQTHVFSTEAFFHVYR